MQGKIALEEHFAIEDTRRSYSICSGPLDGELRIAVKQIDNGLFFTWINGNISIGDAVDVMTPTGRFGLGRDPGEILCGDPAGGAVIGGDVVTESLYAAGAAALLQTARGSPCAHDRSVWVGRDP